MRSTEMDKARYTLSAVSGIESEGPRERRYAMPPGCLDAGRTAGATPYRAFVTERLFDRLTNTAGISASGIQSGGIKTPTHAGRNERG